MLQADLKTFTLAAGEPFPLQVEFQDKVGARIDVSSSAYVLTFYAGDRSVAASIPGEIETDGGGVFVSFVRDGTLSQSLYGKTLKVELAERFHNGRNVIATGTLNVLASALTVASFDNGPIADVATRVVIKDGQSLGMAPAVSAHVVPYADGPAPVSLTALALSTTALTSGTAVTITITGATAGSTITGTPPDGTTLNSAARTIAGTPTTAGSYSMVLTETLAGAVNSPRQTTLGVTVAALPAPVNSTLPTVSGTAQDGQTLTLSNGVWTGSPTSYAYQWNRDGTAIAGSINATRTLTSADVGHVITGTVTATNAGGSAPATSAATAAVIAAATPIPVNTVAPAVTGTGTVGQTLTSTAGTWSNSPTSYAYQWRRDGVDISGATATTYVLATADATHAITCRVYATNAGGTAGATSNAITAAAVVTPTVTLSAAQSKSEGKSGTTLYTYTVTRSATSGAVSIPWSFTPGTTSANDFTGGTYPAGGSVALADGVASGTFTVSVNGDTTVESDESFTVLISTPSGYVAGASTSATGTIVNDDVASLDPPVVSLTPNARYLVSSDYGSVTTPKSAVAHTDGFLDYRCTVVVQLPTLATHFLGGEWSSGTAVTANQSWLAQLTSDGHLVMNLRGGNASYVSVTSTIAATIVKNQKITFRFVICNTNGVAGQPTNTASFYTSTDEGATWTKLGADVTTGLNGTGLQSVSSPFIVGSLDGSNRLYGHTHRAWLVNSAGATVYDADFRNQQRGLVGTFTGGAGETYTLVSNSMISSRASPYGNRFTRSNNTTHLRMVTLSICPDRIGAGFGALIGTRPASRGCWTLSSR